MVKFPIDLNKENYIGVAKKLEILGNKNHLRILLILEETGKPMKSDEIHEILEREEIYSHRENTYRALQKLAKMNLIKKEKGKDKVGDVYLLP